MKSNPLVSIVVITYNSSKFVLETLNSAKEQTYQNIELIVSDDCSTDNTVELCKKWINSNKTRFVRAEIITSPINKGIPANCNSGMKNARGEWLKIIAGDDLLTSECVKLNIENSADNFLLISGGNLLKENEYIYSYPSVISKLISLSIKERLLMFARCNVNLNVPSFFIKKNIFDKIGLYDERFHLLEDEPFMYRVLENGVKISSFKEVTVIYRMGGISNNGYNPLLQKESIDCFNIYRSKSLSNEFLDSLAKFDNIYKKIIYYIYKKTKNRRLCSFMKRFNVFRQIITIYYNKR